MIDFNELIELRRQQMIEMFGKKYFDKTKENYDHAIDLIYFLGNVLNMVMTMDKCLMMQDVRDRVHRYYARALGYLINVLVYSGFEVKWEIKEKSTRKFQVLEVINRAWMVNEEFNQDEFQMLIKNFLGLGVKFGIDFELVERLLKGESGATPQ